MLNTRTATVLLTLGLLAGTAEADDPQPANTTDTTETTTHTAESKVFFEFDSDTLTDAARAELDIAAQWIATNKTGFILIEGHTDKVGSAEYNKGLGDRRARAAREYLRANGVPEERIKVLSYGEGLPNDETEDPSRINRRIVLYAVQKEPIVEQETKVVTKNVPFEVKVPVKEEVYVDRPVYVPVAPTPFDPLGLQVMVGGGLTHSLDDETNDVTDLGGSWDARVAYGNRNLVGFEAAYVGTAQDIDALGVDGNATLLGNGAEADVRLNILRSAPVNPYVFAGVGWTHYSITNTDVNTSSIDDSDEVLHIPAGVGVGIPLYRSMTLDLRGTVRGALDDEMFEGTTPDGDEAAGMENWTAGAQLGFEF